MQEKYEGDLVDLGEQHPAYKQIYSPTYDAAYIGDRLNDQFLGGAEHYAKVYANHKRSGLLIDDGLRLGGFQGTPKDILDVGSGAGNTVIPFIERFPQANVVATDLSIELLRLLRELLQEKAPEHNVGMMQLDVENLAFREDSFDVLFGAAILHHLFEPHKTLHGAARVLRKGGVAMFTEPMQSVNYIVRTLYSYFLADPRSENAHPRLRKYLGLRVKFFDDREGTDKSDPRFRGMDDKWMFPKKYILDQAREAGFSDVIMRPIGDPKKRLWNKIYNHIVVGYGGTMDDLPDWFIFMINEFDKNLPSHMAAEDILAETMIVLVK